MICKNCGAQIPEDSQYCSQCGSEANLYFKCSNCDNIVSAQAVICDKCGAKFKNNTNPNSGKVAENKRGRNFCITAVLFLIMSFSAQNEKGDNADEIKAMVLVTSGLALLIGIISCIEYFRAKQTCSIFTYICIIVAAIIFVLWLVEGDELAAKKVAEYYNSGEYAYDKLREW